MNICSIYPTPFDNQIRHEFNSSIYVDEEIYSYEEAKLSGLKNDYTNIFPERSLLHGCKELNILPKKIDKWILPTPANDFRIETLYYFFGYLLKAFNGPKEDFLNWANKKIIFVDHHLLHAYSTIGPSGFNKCIFVSMDGGGDFGDLRNCIWGEFKNNNIKILGSQKGYGNLSTFHQLVTEFCCFGNENGKVSGLAPYGKINKELKNKLKKLFKVSENGIFFKKIRYSLSQPNIKKVKSPEYERDKVFLRNPTLTNIFKICEGYLIEDVAATAENILSEIFLIFLKKISKKTNLKSIVFSGGLFQNVALNRNIQTSKIFNKYYFPMSPSDGGLSLGGVFKVILQNNLRLKIHKNGLNPFIGPSFTNKEIIDLIKEYKLKFTYNKDFEKLAAKDIIDGKVVGLFQGRAEFGPRSLGARSIIADPQNYESKSKVNQLLKKRDWFMPFAPAIIEENYRDWFDDKNPSYYMQVAIKIKKKLKKLVPSAVHIDNTCRVQLVSKEFNPVFWKIIYQYYLKTKIPMILNTSFNKHGISTIFHLQNKL